MTTRGILLLKTRGNLLQRKTKVYEWLIHQLLGMKWTTAGFQNYYFIRQFSNG
jgi:hypothetical protein